MDEREKTLAVISPPARVVRAAARARALDQWEEALSVIAAPSTVRTRLVAAGCAPY